MIDLGTVRPGSTIRIPFSSFDKDDGSSITMTNYAAADILIYKDGSTTERASTAGFTATTDFDTKTGKHLAVIDLADNTTAGFYNAGSEYLVAIDAVTIDAVTTGGWIARFRIGYSGAMFDTTIATLSTQTSFTLTSGPAEDDALNGRVVIIHDIASAVQCGQAIIADYTGSTKTVTLVAGTTFTAAAGDNISIMDLAPLTPTTIGRTLDVSAGGEAGVDWANVGSPTATINLSGTTVKTATDVETDTADIQSRLPAALVSGRMDASVGAMAANVMTAAAAAADLTTELQSGLATAAALDAVDNFIDTEIASIISTLGTPAGVSVSADIAAVKAQTAAIETDTAEIGVAGAGLTALATQASVNTIDDFLDTEIAAIKTKTDQLTFTTANQVDATAVTNSDKTGYQLSATGVDDVLDEVVEGAVTLRQSVRLANSALGAKASGLETTSAVYRDLADTKDRITATVDADGNRTAVLRDLT